MTDADFSIGCRRCTCGYMGQWQRDADVLQNEIGFAEDEIITQIEQLDEGELLTIPTGLN